MVEADGEELFRSELFTGEGIGSRSGGRAYRAGVGFGVKDQIAGRLWIDGVVRAIDGSYGVAIGISACGGRRDGTQRGRGKYLVKAFIVAEDEAAVMDDGTTEGRAILILAEGICCTRRIKVGASVKDIIAHKFIGGAMELVATGASERIDNTARGEAVRCRIVARDDGKLLQRINTNGDTRGAAGARVGVIVGYDSVQPVAVLLRASTGDGKLGREAAIASAGSGVRIRLAAYQRHAGLKRRQLRPVATV